MNKKEWMEKIIAEELAYIPHWPEPQNILRMMFNMIRQGSLSKILDEKDSQKRNEQIEESRKKDLLESIESVRNIGHPNFEPEYDKEYFDIDMAELKQITPG